MNFRNFLKKFFGKFSKVFSKFPISCGFLPNAQRINDGLLHILKNMLNHPFLANFLNFFEDFRDFLKISNKLWFLSKPAKN